MTAPTPADNPWTVVKQAPGSYWVRSDEHTISGLFNRVDAERVAAALNDAAQLEARVEELQAELDYARSRAEESLAESAQLTLDAEDAADTAADRAEAAETALAATRGDLAEARAITSCSLCQSTFDIPDQPNPTGGDDA